MRAEADDKKAELFEETLRKETFPSEKITHDWVKNVRKSIRNTAPFMLRMGLQDFADVLRSKVVTCGDKSSVSLFEFGVLTNSLECVSPNLLELGDEEYGTFISETIMLIEYFKKRSKEIRIAGDSKVDADLQMKLAALADKNSKKPIMGQA